jgi:hypothetical protein
MAAVVVLDQKATTNFGVEAAKKDTGLPMFGRTVNIKLAGLRDAFLTERRLHAVPDEAQARAMRLVAAAAAFSAAGPGPRPWNSELSSELLHAVALAGGEAGVCDRAAPEAFTSGVDDGVDEEDGCGGGGGGGGVAGNSDHADASGAKTCAWKLLILAAARSSPEFATRGRSGSREGCLEVP